MEEKIRRELARVDAERQKILRRINAAPPGQLRCRRNGNYYKFYRSFDDGTQQYISAKEKDLTKQLAEKEYQKSKLHKLETQAKAYEACLKVFDSAKSSTDKIYTTPLYKEILRKHSDDAAIRGWLDNPPKKNVYYAQNLTIPTSEGSLVRSKSEALISEALYRSLLPFFYDRVLHLDSGDVYPDFTIMHPKTHEIYFWEHLGLVDRENYLNKNLSKIRDYIRNGIVPSDRLILTWETEKVPLSPVYVEEMINYYFG